MNEMRNLISALLGLVVLAALAGCGGPEPAPTILPVQTPTPQPTEPATLTPTPPPTATPSLMATPTAVPSPQPYPTPEWAPYEDEPFTVVFQRDGELWLSEVGGRGEWALTRERPEWGAGEFAISPDGQTIAFSAWSEGENSCIKLVSIGDGTTRVLAGQGDPYQEFNIAWWDATHVVFQILNDPVAGYEEDPSIWDEVQPFTLVIVDVETGERVLEPASSNSILYPSPNAGYVLSERFSTSWERLPYQLQDRETGERRTVTGEGEPASFLSWSPDSRFMLFGPSRETDDYAVLFVVDAEARTRQVVTPEDKVAHSGTWSPDGQIIAYNQCDLPASACQNPELWLTSPDDSNPRPVSLGQVVRAEHISWTPDGSRLVFKARYFGTQSLLNMNIWSVRVDGTDLRPIAKGHEYQVLPVP